MSVSGGVGCNPDNSSATLSIRNPSGQARCPAKMIPGRDVPYVERRIGGQSVVAKEGRLSCSIRRISWIDVDDPGASRPDGAEKRRLLRILYGNLEKTFFEISLRLFAVSTTVIYLEGS